MNILTLLSPALLVIGSVHSEETTNATDTAIESIEEITNSENMREDDNTKSTEKPDITEDDCKSHILERYL